MITEMTWVEIKKNNILFGPKRQKQKHPQNMTTIPIAEKIKTRKIHKFLSHFPSVVMENNKDQKESHKANCRIGYGQAGINL